MNDTSRRIETRETEPAESIKKHLESTIIPSSFWLGGLKINVEFDNTLVKNKNVIGAATYCNQQITLDPSVAPLQMLEQSYYHELVHWIFYMMGEEELRCNEKIVDLFAHFLYQARMTEERVNSNPSVITPDSAAVM